MTAPGLLNVTAAPSPDLAQLVLEYRAILENASVAILFTRHSKVLHCNARFAEIFGWASPEELKDQPGSVFWPTPEEYAEVGRNAGPMLASGQAFELERLMRRKNGSLFLCHVVAKAVNPAATAEGTIWIGEDVTEKRQAEETTRKLMLQQQAILQNASVGILFTQEGGIQHCNARMEQMFGWSAGELIGKSARVFFDSDEEYGRFGRQAGPILTSGNQLDIEWDTVRKDGSHIWCRILARAVVPGDITQGTIWTTEDVSARHLAEQAINVLISEQRAILDTAVIGIVFLRDRVIQRCNRRFEEIFGYAPGELDGKPMRLLYPSDAAYILGGKPYDNLAQGLSHQREQVLIRRDGSRFWCRIAGRMIDVERPEKGTVALFDDITERKQAEAALRQAHDELEQRVDERTAELAQANLRLQEEVSERQQAENRVLHLANHDALTGLPNRRLLLDRLGQALAMAHREHHHVAVLFMDLDRFKTINDSLGHMMGDALLQTVARRLQVRLREGDTISRLGGDEFVVVLPSLDHPEAAEKVALKLVEALSPPFDLDGQELRASASIGISLFPEDGRDTETLLRNADSAMYHAKEMGRNNYQFFMEQMNVAAAERLRLENDLHKALERDEFELHYQPKISVASGKVCGIEALIRWRHPERGLVPPAQFIPVAEDTGLIVPIGEWVIQEACRQGKAWCAAGLPRIPVAVNLSPRQFRQSNLVDTVARALAQHDWPGKLLELEITEGVLMQQTADTLKTLEALSRLGIGLAIDDFGTGYSSLSYLKRFPVDCLKIDQSFVRDIAVDPEDAVIVTTIIGLAHSLGLAVVAEGVENASQLAFIRNAGCDEAQGFHFSSPMPANQLAAWVLANQPAEKVKDA
jgi:diguanylate cyclase (GGDEF)-like protein/PAS domain S-box-containing protein